MTNLEPLIQIGLDEKEANIYLAVLALGEATVLPIAKKSGIQRTYCYDILGELTKKGFVSFTEIRGRRHYSAIEPKAIKKIISERMKQFDEIIPSLEGLYQNAPLRPKVRFFEGVEGISILYEEILFEAKEAWFLGSVSDWAGQFPDFVGYVKREVAKGIKIRELVRANDNTIQEYQKLFQEGVQETRLLPESAIFHTDNMLWNNKLVMVSYGADLYAVAIESAEIAQTFRAIYEILWPIAQKI